MPLDPSIPLSVRPPQGLDIAGAMRQAASLKQLALQSEQTQQQIAATGQAMQERQHASEQQTATEQAWKEAFTNVDGVMTLDRAKITTRLAAQGIDPTHILKGLDDADTALRAKQKAQRELDAADNDAIAGLAYSISKAGNTPEAWQTGLRYLQANNAVDAAKLKPYDDAVKADPSNIGKITAAIIAKSEKYTKIAQEDTKEADTVAGRKADDVRADKALTQTQTYQSGMLKVAQENAASNARRATAAEQTANPLGAIQGGQKPGTPTAAPATGPSGAEFLSTLPPNIASEVKAYAEGRRPFPTGFALKSPYFQALIQLVGQYDPTFDAANYNARSKTRTDLTSPSGAGGKTINALNTAIQHAGKLSDLIETLDNTEYPLANAIVNPLRTATGSTKVTNFKAVAPQLAKEIERAWVGAGGASKDINALIDSIGQNLGRQQQREALQQFVELAKGKLDATQQQRDNVMGPAGASIPVLFDQNKALIEKIAQRASGAAEPTKVGKYTVTVKP